MGKRHFHIIRCKAIMAVVALAVFIAYPIEAFAVENITLPLQMMGDDIVSVSLPVTGESGTSVFDFILDPQGLLYETDAVRYGGGRVEEGATLLFHNEEGEYDFSKRSDWLTVTNRSTVPVRVTVTAQVTDFGDVRLAESADFGESTEPEVYLAMEDDQGNILPLSVDEQVTINLEMASAPENTYVFKLDEETHTYQYGMSMDPNRIDFDTYSFGLTGACNSNAEWQNISAHPMITVTWYVEPIMPEEQEETPVVDNNISDENNTPNDDDKSVDESTGNDVDDEIDRGGESNQSDGNNQNDGGNNNHDADQSVDTDQRDENDDDNSDDSRENDNGQDEGVVDEE